MSEPKFHVGQKVAVCAHDLSIIIPASTVLASCFANAGDLIRDATGKNRSLTQVKRTAWNYMVENGKGHWFRETSLRPLNDDDYKPETTESEKEVAR